VMMYPYLVPSKTAERMSNTISDAIKLNILLSLE
jgi:hypothetical protein